MKEYRLNSWPDLPAPFQGSAYRRMVNDMSHRHMTLAQLVSNSGVRRHEVRQFLDSLDTRGVLEERELFARTSMRDSLQSWISVTQGKVKALLGKA